MSRRAALAALAVCLFALTAGCAAFAGPPGTGTDTTTTTGTETTAGGSVPTVTTRPQTPTLTGTALPVELPAGVDRSDVARFSMLSAAERETFAAARNASGYVELPSDGALETFGNLRYVFADDRLWTVRATYGRVAYYASTTELDANETAVAYGSLSAEDQRRFRHIVNASGSYVLGPDERPVDFPDPVRYENRTYVVEKGTASSTYGVLAVFPVESQTDSPS